MIVFCHVDVAGVEKVLDKIRSDYSDFSWGIIGEDHKIFERLYSVFGSERRDKEIGPLFQTISRQLRPTMLEFMGRLSKSNHSVEWWCTGLASKSIFQQNLFKMVCHINLIQEIEKKEKNIILLIADFESFTLFKKIFSDRFMFLTDKYALYEWWKNLSRLFKQKYIRLVNLIIHKLVLRGRIMIPLDMETLVFSWVTDKSVTEELHYKDLWGGIFFDEFSKFSSCKRFTPSFIKPRSLKLAFLSDAEFLYTSQYCSWLDILALLITKVKMKSNIACIFQGIDIRPILDAEIRKYNAGKIYEYMIFYKALVRIINGSPKLKIIFHPFEGQPWEKMIKLAIRDSKADITALGFQHSAFSELHLSNFCSPLEYRLGTMPDFILANSEYNRRKLGNDGFPPDRILMIGDLRFGYLNKAKRKIALSSNSHEETILVCLSIKLDESLMVLHECCLAFRNLRNKGYPFKAYIKPHPLKPLNIENLSFVKGLEDCLEYVDGDLKPVLDKSDIVIYINGAVGCEALQLGKKVIQKITDLSIDLDPLNPHEKQALLSPCFFHELDGTLELLLADDNMKKTQRDYKMKIPSFFDPVQHHVIEKLVHLTK